jgi:UDP-2,3-diacylglucosamine pyrophosphatase LpxH
MLKRHLDYVKSVNGAVIDVGDLFCAMQGKYDKRADKSALRPEHQDGDYLRTITKWMHDLHAPYAEHLVRFAHGNHETAIRKNHEFDLTADLCERLRRDGSPVSDGGYTGWVRFQLYRNGVRRGSVRLWYTHGYGGGGPVTKDMIQRARQLAYVRNADIMVSGHTHDRWLNEDVVLEHGDDNRVRRRRVIYAKCGTYKDEYGTGRGGFPIEKGHPPKPLGAWYLVFRWVEERFTFEFREAN